MKRLFNSNKFHIYISIIIILVGISSFLLGGFAVLSIYKKNNNNSDFKLILEDFDTDFNANRVYASKRGSRYYPWWCESSIRDKNKLWFNDPNKAISKGYSKAKNC